MIGFLNESSGIEEHYDVGHELDGLLSSYREEFTGRENGGDQVVGKDLSASAEESPRQVHAQLAGQSLGEGELSLPGTGMGGAAHGGRMLKLLSLARLVEELSRCSGGSSEQLFETAAAASSRKLWTVGGPRHHPPRLLTLC